MQFWGKKPHPVRRVDTSLCLILQALDFHTGSKTSGHVSTFNVNPLESRDNYSATLNNMKLVHWPLMGGLLHLIQQARDWAGPRGLGGTQPTQAPQDCTNNSPPINGQCRPTNHCIAV